MTSRARLALLVLGGYVVVAFAVHDRYPFSVFDMYSRVAANGSRIVARDGGRTDEVDHYRDWSCDGEIDLDARHCGREGAIETTDPVDHELIGWVRSHLGSAADARPVDLVRRTWYFSGGGVRVEDCLLQHCRAVRRD
jgi:hypothetical protein